ncbi:hypothetical protein NDU88_001727 [Pleurodeles waltl]|uniref:LON peptidase N-terminal domain and ring finger 3 n=1 Tax=Pleurodeles waltl TaxID=8319 RepID=A0AAV7VCM0_PLEWA|nr:hypothetical protein NDU88_001727 [Pleurodeles waltl]
MLEFAAEAFQAGNFELAAEIYECQWRERGEAAGWDWELPLRTADALCGAGRVPEALALYQRAAACGEVRAGGLEALVLSLADSVRSREGVCGERLAGATEFLCPHCGGFFCDPVSLPCGHTFCRCCLEKDPATVEIDPSRRGPSAPLDPGVSHTVNGQPGEGGHAPAEELASDEMDCEGSHAPAVQELARGPLAQDSEGSALPDSYQCVCPLCREPVNPHTVRSYRTNVVLTHLLTKWFPSSVKAQHLRHEGNALYKRKEFAAALQKYDEALYLAPNDHVLHSNRSQINMSLKCIEAALHDAETVCRIQPLWLKGHMRKGQALAKLGKTEEALREYLFCLALDMSNKTAMTESQKLLLNLISLLSGTSQGQIPDILQVFSHHSRLKGNILNSWSLGGASNYPPSSLKVITEQKRDSKSQELPAPTSYGLMKSVPKENKRSFPDVGEKLSFPLESASHNFLKRKHCSDNTNDSRSLEIPRKLMRKDVCGPKSSGTEHPMPAECIDPADLDCSLCMRLFYEPVTTPCGHTFCLKCLERCLDHNSACPLCKEDLSKYLALRKYCKTELMEALIARYLPDELTERQKVYEEEVAELSNLNTNVPIFVCTMAYPTVPCPLHIFEPCYRLMIRRCMETGTKQFGMCISDAVKGFADYGCMLEIRNVEFFSDGRSVVDSIGKRRFKVIQHSQRDGYNTADIEYIEDEKVHGLDCAELLTLHDSVYDQAHTWFNSLKEALKSRILGHFGPMPTKDTDPQINPNGPSWCWWILAVLPLENKAQLPFLAMTSLKDRLNSIRRVLMFISRSRSR